jgi:hypothetical protein
VQEASGAEKWLDPWKWPKPACCGFPSPEVIGLENISVPKNHLSPTLSIPIVGDKMQNYFSFYHDEKSF